MSTQTICIKDQSSTLGFSCYDAQIEKDEDPCKARFKTTRTEAQCMINLTTAVVDGMKARQFSKLEIAYLESTSMAAISTLQVFESNSKQNALSVLDEARKVTAQENWKEVFPQFQVKKEAVKHIDDLTRSVENCAWGFTEEESSI